MKQSQSDPRLAFVAAYEARPDVQAALKLVRKNKRLICGDFTAGARTKLARLLGVVGPKETPDFRVWQTPAPYVYAMQRVCAGRRGLSLYEAVRTFLAREAKP